MPDMNADLAAYRQQQLGGQSNMDSDLAAYRQGNNQNAVASLATIQNTDPNAPSSMTGNQIQNYTNAAGAAQSATNVAGQNTKIDPDFVDKLSMINDGVNRGVTHFTLGLMSKLPFGDNYQNAIKKYDDQVQAQQDYNTNTYKGVYPQVGEALGEILATLPAGGLLGKVSSAAEGLGTAAKYAATGVGSAGVMAGTEGLKYDPNDPTAFNTQAAQNALNNPLSYALPIGAKYLQGWAGNANALSQAKQVLPDIRMADLVANKSPLRNGLYQGLDLLPSITGTSKQVAQMDNIGQSVSNYVQKLSGLPETMSMKPTDLMDYAGKQVQSALQSLKNQGENLWSQVPMDTPLADQEGAHMLAQEALGKITASQLPGNSLVKNSIEQITNKPLTGGFNPETSEYSLNAAPLTVGDAKKLQTLIGKSAMNAFNTEGGVGIDLGRDLMDNYRTPLLDHIQNSLDTTDQAAFAAARQHSSMLKDFQSNSPLIQQAITDDTSAKDLVRSIIGNSGASKADKTAGMLNVMNPAGNPGGLSAPSAMGQQAVAAARLGQIMDQAGQGGSFNIQKFLDGTANNTNIPNLMNNDAYKSLQGFNQYLKNINDMSQSSNWYKKLGVGGVTLGGLAAGGFLHGGSPGAIAGGAAGLASYLATNYAVNNSPLKTLFSAAMKNLPDSTQQYITNAITNHLTRAGFYMNQAGVLQHKDEQNVNPGR